MDLKSSEWRVWRCLFKSWRSSELLSSFWKGKWKGSFFNYQILSQLEWYQLVCVWNFEKLCVTFEKGLERYYLITKYWSSLSDMFGTPIGDGSEAVGRSGMLSEGRMLNLLHVVHSPNGCSSGTRTRGRYVKYWEYVMWVNLSVLMTLWFYRFFFTVLL